MTRMFAAWLAASLAVTATAGAQELRLTKPAVRLAHQFSGINGFRELSDGRVLVADGIDDVVLRIDLATGKIDTLGRAGPGPGEYKSPDGLFALPNDATLLVDLGNARMSVFDGTGKHRESFPIAQGQPGAGPGPVPLIFPRGTDSRGRIYFQPVGGGGDSGSVVRWDRAAARFDTVAKVKLPPLITRTSGGPNSRNVRQQPPPYPVQDNWAVAPDGRVALIRAPGYRVDWAAAGGRTTGKLIPAPPVPVRAAEKKEFMAESAANGLSVSIENNNGQVSMRFARGRRDDDGDEPDTEGMEWPAAKPPFTGTSAVGPDGRLWVERSVAANAPRSYDLIGPAGDVVGRVVAPAGRRLIGVGAKGAYFRHVDADGISYLERYDVR